MRFHEASDNSQVFVLILSAALFVLSAIGLKSDARADGGLSLHLASGMSNFRLKAGETFDKTGGFGLEMRLQFNIDWSSFNSALDFFYQGRLGSSIGAFPANRVGTGLIYYPMGMALHTTVLDSGVMITQNRFAPFFMGQASLITLSVTDKTMTPPAFNALAVGYQLGVGAEIPVGQTWAFVLEFLYEGTLAGGSSNNQTTTSASGVVFSGYGGLLGVAIHP